jgi:fermentation-respiration switch protein FrsA (DUF1100 family)
MLKLFKSSFLYIGIVLSLVVFSSCKTTSFFYNPLSSKFGTPDSNLCSVEVIDIPSKNGKLLRAWFIKPKNQKVIASLLLFHGNADNISYQHMRIMPLIRSGFQALVFDYQGFGDSQGHASQKHVYQDGVAALKYFKSREDVKNTKCVLYGQSLGGHLAIVIAAKYQDMIDALVIEGAFSSHTEIAKTFAKNVYHLPVCWAPIVTKDKYSAIKEIGKITIPKLLIYTREDETVPFNMGEELYAKAVAPKEFWEVKGGHLRAVLYNQDEFISKFKKILKL